MKKSKIQMPTISAVFNSYETSTIKMSEFGVGTPDDIRKILLNASKAFEAHVNPVLLAKFK